MNKAYCIVRIEHIWNVDDDEEPTIYFKDIEFHFDKAIAILRKNEMLNLEVTELKDIGYLREYDIREISIQGYSPDYIKLRDKVLDFQTSVIDDTHRFIF